MTVTVYLAEPLTDDRTEIECERARVSEGLLEADTVDDDGIVVVPIGNVAGIEATSMKAEPEQHPMQGGQYTQFVSHLS